MIRFKKIADNISNGVKICTKENMAFVVLLFIFGCASAFFLLACLFIVFVELDASWRQVRILIAFSFVSFICFYPLYRIGENPNDK